jgi:hypothetical protein
MLRRAGILLSLGIMQTKSPLLDAMPIDHFDIDDIVKM